MNVSVACLVVSAQPLLHVCLKAKVCLPHGGGLLCAVLIRNAAVYALSQIWLAAACAANYEQVPQKTAEPSSLLQASLLVPNTTYSLLYTSQEANTFQGRK